MRFPLSLLDIGLWLAIMAIILLMTSEALFSTTDYSRNIIIEKKRLRLIALGLGISFIITVIIRVVQSV
jgi:hypothetical protein